MTEHALGGGNVAAAAADYIERDVGGLAPGAPVRASGPGRRPGIGSPDRLRNRLEESRATAEIAARQLAPAL